MKHCFIITLLAITFGYKSISQNNSGLIEYTYTITEAKNNSSKSGLPGFTTSVLHFKKDKTYYYEMNPSLGQNESSISKISNSDNNSSVVLRSNEALLFQLFIDYRIDSFYISDFVIRKFENYCGRNVEPKWLLSDQYKTIGKFKCQMASTDLLGRKWEAWFTSEIPYPYGPWRLNGLPGLILEANDIEGKYLFSFNKIIFPANFPSLKFEQDIVNRQITFVNEESFIIKRKKRKADLEALLKANSQDGNSSVTVKGGETRENY
jgi:GLPGLI family protein